MFPNGNLGNVRCVECVCGRGYQLGIIVRFTRGRGGLVNWREINRESGERERESGEFEYNGAKRAALDTNHDLI